MNRILLARYGLILLQAKTSLPTRRWLHGRVAAPPPPAARGTHQSPNDLLAAIGRSSDSKLKVETWEDLWRMRGDDMKKAGVAVADRRYIMWALEKFRQGYDPAKFAIKERPKKTIRGWGPRVQNGKRVR